MPKSYHLDDIAKDRYTNLRKSNQILPFQNKLKHDKLIIGGSIRETYGQDYEPFNIWKSDYDPNLDPMSWTSVLARRASFDPLMESGNNNKNRKDKTTNKIKHGEPYKRK